MSITAIVGAKIFDGETTLSADTVVIDDGVITAIGTDVPAGATIVDGTGATLLPGLIDAHVHTNRDALALALRFGVTTELEMQGTHTGSRRAAIAEDDSVADVRSAGFGLTPPGGHPSELFPADFHPGPPPGAAPTGPRPVKADVSTPAEAVAVIPQLVADGSDYIKFMVDDGSVEGHPGLPMLDQETLEAGVAAAHSHGMLTIAHP
ncbi:hypothetical protein QSJ18_10690 [Gordonia sp. ABSL1-1]|uniref:amidohydrolase family protein n=1 Tax=Gordonia sp. ABSL1-1 TaxID=3053923 RepID=UPI00257259B5|nr:hypothetical protein [Gordonia sp. ABSL1-1]MDL9937210.1 hypothetical protein [Gordonia sp. ABSL1-1]